VRVLARKKPRLTPEEVLLSRPVRNEGLQTEPLPDGGIRIVVERRREWWVRGLAVVLPIPKRRPIELDEVGRQVWDMCDGEHTLRDMVKEFQARHKLSRAEAEWSLRTYLRDLGKRGLVAIAVRKSGGS
jgi:Coenzyme PQQ synthesis protein D (PqqD)